MSLDFAIQRAEVFLFALIGGQMAVGVVWTCANMIMERRRLNRFLHALKKYIIAGRRRGAQLTLKTFDYRSIPMTLLALPHIPALMLVGVGGAMEFFPADSEIPGFAVTGYLFLTVLVNAFVFRKFRPRRFLLDGMGNVSFDSQAVGKLNRILTRITDSHVALSDIIPFGGRRASQLGKMRPHNGVPGVGYLAAGAGDDVVLLFALFRLKTGELTSELGELNQALEE